MPRRSGGGSRRPMRRPMRRASTQKRSASTSAQKKAPAKPAQQTPAAAPAAGGSMMGGFIGNALSFAAGHVIGQGISRMLWPAQDGASEEQVIEQEKQLVEKCSDNVKALNDCLEHYNEDIGKCQFYLTELQECKKERIDNNPNVQEQL